MPTPHTFLIPDPATFVSGGNLYNAELMLALEKQSVPYCRCSLEEFEVTIPNGITWIDTLWMKDWSHEYQGTTGLIVHHLGSMYPESDADTTESERKLIADFDLFLCTSEFTAGYLEELGIERDRCIIVEPGMHLEVPDHREYPIDPLKALIVANLVPRKGILPFLEAVQDLAYQGGDFTITIAGSSMLDPGYAQACKDFVADSSALAEKIEFVGELNQAEMRDAYLAHSIFLSPSMMETYGMAIKEALCMGLPTFTMANAGFSQFHFDQMGQSGARASSHRHLAEFLIQTARSSRHRDSLFDQQWQNKPAPLTWTDQARSFTQQTESWLAKR